MARFRKSGLDIRFVRVAPNLNVAQIKAHDRAAGSLAKCLELHGRQAILVLKLALPFGFVCEKRLLVRNTRYGKRLPAIEAVACAEAVLAAAFAACHLGFLRKIKCFALASSKA